MSYSASLIPAYAKLSFFTARLPVRELCFRQATVYDSLKHLLMESTIPLRMLIAYSSNCLFTRGKKSSLTQWRRFVDLMLIITQFDFLNICGVFIKQDDLWCWGEFVASGHWHDGGDVTVSVAGSKNVSDCPLVPA